MKDITMEDIIKLILKIAVIVVAAKIVRFLVKIVFAISIPFLALALPFLAVYGIVKLVQDKRNNDVWS